MKKIWPLLVAAALAACGGDASNDQPRPVLLATSSAQSAQAKGPPSVLGERRSYDITWTNNTLRGTSAVPGLANFEFASSEVRLQDISLTFDKDGTAGKLYRLYQAAFGRVPDVKGFGYWKSAMESKGVSLDQVAAAFLDSAESKVKYGTSNDDSTYVGRLYQNVLHRGADSAGAAFWTSSLKSGVKRSDVLISFADSDENKNATAATAARGMPFAEPGIEYVPVSNATGPKDVPLGIPFDVDATSSTDANDDPLGFLWTVTARPTGSLASFANPLLAKNRIVLDVPGTYQLSVRASDPHAQSFSPAQLTVVAHSLIADSGTYTCSGIDAARASTLYSLGHTYLDRDKDGRPCTAADIDYERAPKVPAIADSGIYKCSTISHEFAVLLYLQGHTYLDRDHDGKPCEATDITVEKSTYVPPSNAGMCWVNGYYRRSGTYVSGYWRRC